MNRSIIRVCSTFVLVVGATVMLTACQSDNATTQASMMDTSGDVAMGAINDTCPMMPTHKVDPNVTVQTVNGKTVGFCCAGCIDAWHAKSDAERAAYVAAHSN